MTAFSRRTITATLLALGALPAAGCSDRATPTARAVRFDEARLARGFEALAGRAHPAPLGLGVAPLDGGPAWTSDPTARFPLQGVAMAPLAAAALALVDAGRLGFNETVRIGLEDFSPLASRIKDAFRGQPLAVHVADLIALAVQEDDNTAADALMRRLGGPAAVTAWLAAHGLGDLRADRYERELQTQMIGLAEFRPEWASAAGWSHALDSLVPDTLEASIAAYLADPRDTATVPAALTFLTRLSGGSLLSPASTGLLIRLMSGSRPGGARLRAGLPRGARLAHVSGGAETVLGITPATNDIGLVTLSDGRRFAIAAFLSGSTATAAQRDGLIADAARLAVSALI